MPKIPIQKRLDFKDTLVKFMLEKTADMTEEKKIAYVYNAAIEDGLNFMDEMSKSNPQHKLAFFSLRQEFKNWLLPEETP